VRKLDVAQHEAGHAVVGVWLGMSLRVVRVDPASYVELDGYTDFRRTKTNALHYAIMCAAGPAADAICGRDEPDMWEPDFGLIKESGFSTKERRVLIDMATRYLRGPCRRAWQKVTDELMSRDLSGKEIKALVAHGEPMAEE
jgi:hypothetical protein